jgi:hypothetical protein
MQLVSKPDQLFPRFVMDTLGNYPGVPGLFVAGIFSGALRYTAYLMEFLMFVNLPIRRTVRFQAV